MIIIQEYVYLPMIGHFFSLFNSHVLVTVSCALISLYIAGLFVCLSREVTSFNSKYIVYKRENQLASFFGENVNDELSVG